MTKLQRFAFTFFATFFTTLILIGLFNRDSLDKRIAQNEVYIKELVDNVLVNKDYDDAIIEYNNNVIKYNKTHEEFRMLKRDL